MRLHPGRPIRGAPSEHGWIIYPLGQRRRSRLQASVRDAGRWFKKPELFFSLTAILLSMFSFLFSCSTSKDVAWTDTIKTEYGVLDELAKIRIDKPQMSHLFATSRADYDRRLIDLSNQFAEVEKARLRATERAVADQIFLGFEQTYYSWLAAKNARDYRRAKWLVSGLGDFATLLCNRRLVWYWSNDGGRLGPTYGAGAREFYAKNIKGICTDKDEFGPYAPVLPQ